MGYAVEGNFVYLPPYSPSLNRIERFWKIVKRNWFPHTSVISLNCARRSICL
ncbi:MAG: transposase [Spirochaetaceae bacterium]|nr:transposase [Spirochaetaceae bacterium]